MEPSFIKKSHVHPCVTPDVTDWLKSAKGDLLVCPQVTIDAGGWGVIQSALQHREPGPSTGHTDWTGKTEDPGSQTTPEPLGVQGSLTT